MWFKEIARRRRAETRRLKELESLAKAMERSQAVLELRPNATVVRANGAFQRLTGYASPEIVGCPHSLFLAEGETDSDEYREFWRALHRGEPITKTTQLFGKEGAIVRVRAAYSPVLDTAGKLKRVILFATDVSELKIEVVRPVIAPGRTDDQDQVITVLSEQFKALAAGDLTARVDVVFSERYGHVRDEFNAAMTKLGQVMDEIDLHGGWRAGRVFGRGGARLAASVARRGASGLGSARCAGGAAEGGRGRRAGRGRAAPRHRSRRRPAHRRRQRPPFGA